MKKKVRIKGLPTGQSGLEVKMNHLRAGLGFNANVMPWPIMAGKMSAPPTKVNSTLKPIPREEANLEAEKDEVAMIPGQGSIPDTYTIGGKRHHSGGTPLNLPENSFIFSDTAKMRIKDPAVLAQFGLSPKKNGYTPAEIAKKYNTAPYKKLLADKTTDDLQRETAELMLSNFNLKLGKLALIQESMKGFPQGIPEIAMPYLEAMQINPEDLMQQNPGAPENAEDAAGQESAMEIGGPVMAQQPGAPLQYLQDGGTDYFDEGGPNRRDYKTAPTLTPEQMAFSKANLYPTFNDIYNTMLKNRTTDQIDELGNAGADIDLQNQLKIANAASSGKPRDPGTYAKNLNNLFGENVIAFPTQPGSIVENWQGETEIESEPSIDEANKNISDNIIRRRYLKDFNVLNPQKDFEAEKRDQYYDTQEIAYGGTIDYFAMGGLTKYQGLGPSQVSEMPWDIKNKNGTRSVDMQKFPGFGYPDALKNFQNPNHEFEAEQTPIFWEYEKALRSDNPEIMEALANKLDKIDVPNSVGWLPWTQQDKMQDLAGVLRERVAAVKPATNKSKDVKKEQATPGWSGNKENEQEFAKNYKDDYKAYTDALKSGDPMTMINTAKELAKRASSATGDWSWKGVPWSDANKFTDLSTILYEKAAPKKAAPKKTQDENVQDAAKKIYDRLNKLYTEAPDGYKKLQAKSALEDFASKYSPYTKKTAKEKAALMQKVQMPFAPVYNKEESDYINLKQKELFPELYGKDAAVSDTTKVAPKVSAGAKEAGFQNTQVAPTETIVVEGDEFDRLEAERTKKKEYGGSIKKVRITGLPGMARGGSLQQYQKAGQFNGISANSPLMNPGTQLNFNDPNYASQAAVATSYSLDSSIPADSPLNKPATKLDFTSSEPVKSQSPLAYKDTKVKWNDKSKTRVSGPAKAQGIMALEQGVASIFRNKEMQDLEKKIKGNQFEQFTPTFGSKGSWSQSPSSLGLQDPNSNIVQQPGFMTMRQNTFGYGNREFGGAMDEYKWGGYTQNATKTEWGAYNDLYPGKFFKMDQASYDKRVAQEKAAEAQASQAQPSSGVASKAAPKGAPASSTIGVYTPEWTAYLTGLAKSSGMSMDDPRFKAKLPAYFFDEGTGKLKSQAELEKLTKTQATQSALTSGAFGEDYWNDAYKPDFIRRHKKLIDKFEAEHPGESFDPTKKDINSGTQSSHLKWFQEAYNKEAKEKGAPTYDFGAPNKLGRLTYSAPSLQDFDEPKKEEGVATTTKPETEKKTAVPAAALKYQHLAQPRINTPAFGWTIQDMNNMGRAVASYFGTRKHMPYEATPNFYQADTVFDDPTRRIAAMNEQRNIGAQNMAGLTNPQAYMSNFLAGNNLGDVANAISDVHSRNINIANQRDAYNAQALNAFDAERANRQTRLYDKNTLAQVSYEAERAAKGDVMGQMFNTGMKNAADLYNINQLHPQFALTPLTQTMFHSNPRALKPKYEQEKDLAATYNEILSTYTNLNETAEGRKVALEAAKQKLNMASTPEDPYLAYQRDRAQSQIPQVNPYAYTNEES